MLGPSGSGKTTVLRIIAGFETATSGQVILEGSDVTELAPFDRDVNTVFQDYALFPHMTIQQNVEYGLRARKIPKPERAKLASDAIESVKLSHLADRLPHQLGLKNQQLRSACICHHYDLHRYSTPHSQLKLKAQSRIQERIQLLNDLLL